jgi:hypothetical protein
MSRVIQVSNALQRALLIALLTFSSISFADGIQRVPVESTNLRSVGFDPKTKTLEIAFKHGGVYRYHGVPLEVHLALMGSESKGKFFQANIRNKFEFEKVGTEK